MTIIVIVVIMIKHYCCTFRFPIPVIIGLGIPNDHVAVEGATHFL